MGKKQLQTLPELTADVARLVEDLQQETDRGAALVGAAFLDDVLDVTLRAVFVEEPDAVNKLMGMGRPLESFGARTHLAYCLGLLGTDVYADINLIREIRNDFAHRHPTSFEFPEIRTKCQKLKCLSVMLADDSCSARERFIASVMVIANHLMISASAHQHAKPAKKFSENGVLRLR
jgi:DNA-binding MltR family transcriptional regulator